MKLFTQFALLCCLGLPLSAHAQSEFHLQQQTLANPDNEPAPVHPVPSPRQLKWQETEFYAFFHYGMNTYTGLEWGNGDENENRFAPTRVPNPEQWLQAAKDAGMRGGIAVIKHHDGFCLWPTATTTHNATSSSNPNAKQTNIPRDFAEAARKLNMKYGFYISPWDRNSALYGTDRYVKEVFLRQCLEAAQYGNDQFEMWFDGANGGNGYYGGQNKTINVGDANVYYDVPNLRDSVHKAGPVKPTGAWATAQAATSTAGIGTPARATPKPPTKVGSGTAAKPPLRPNACSKCTSKPLVATPPSSSTSRPISPAPCPPPPSKL